MSAEPSKDLVLASNAYSRANLTERQQYAIMLARAGDLLPPNLQAGMVRDKATGQMVKQGSAGKTFLLAETGDMLGIHPLAAIVGVHIIDGKPSISANLMSGLVRKAGHTLRVKTSGSADDETLTATAQLIRSDDPDYTYEVTWTVADAKRAGLWPGKDSSNWRKYPRSMMKSRVISEIVREAASDVLMGGNVYTPEELGAEVNDAGEPINLTQVPDVDLPQGGAPEGDVPRETPPPAEARPETPIPDEPAPEPTENDFDWAQAIRNLASRQEALDLYQRGKTEGVLDREIKVGRKKGEIGKFIIEVGQALAEAEAAAAAAEAGDENVVDAEVVEDDPKPEGGES